MRLPQTFCALLVAAVGIPATLAGPTNQPKLRVQLPEFIRQEDIVVGDDIYLECKGPGEHEKGRFVWEHNGVPLEQDHSRGIVMVTNMLVLQNLSPSSRGQYSCREAHGDGVSAPYTLRMQYKPVSEQKDSTVYVNLTKEVELECVFEGNPLPDIAWSYERASGDKAFVNENITEDVNGERRRSVLKFRPMSGADYVTFTCKAFNSAGMASVRFTLKPPEPPEDPLQCSMYNGDNKLWVTCVSVGGIGSNKNNTFTVDLGTYNGAADWKPVPWPQWNLNNVAPADYEVVNASNNGTTIKKFPIQKNVLYKLN